MKIVKSLPLVPRLRFPEFQDGANWEETTIGNLGEVITGSTPSTSRRDFYGGDIMFVSPPDISDLKFVKETKKTLTETGFAKCRPIKKTVSSEILVSDRFKLCKLGGFINQLIYKLASG